MNTKNWWYCDNIIAHPEQIGLLSLNEPNVFILIRSYADCYFSDFEEFKNSIAEVNFLHPADRDTADIDSILIDAWNFLALAEQADEDYIARYEDDLND